MYLPAITAACAVGSLSRGAGIAEVSQAASAWSASSDPTTPRWLLAGLAETIVAGPVSAAPALRRALAEAPPSDTSMVQGIHWLGYQCAAATALWDADAAHELAVAHVELTREIGALSMLSVALDSLAQVLVLEGDLDGARSAMVEAGQISELTGSRLLSSGVALCAGLVGDDGAEELISAEIARAQAAGFGLPLKFAQWSMARIHNGRGEYDRALSAAVEAIAHPWDWSSHLFVHELVEAAARCGKHAVAATALERLSGTIEENSSDWAIGMEVRCRALLAEGTAEKLYLEAIERLRRTRIRPELARTHLLYGEWLRRQNRRGDARTQLRTAHEMFVEMRMHAFATRARHELLATGEVAHRLGVHSFDALTPHEAHIARLAAEGRTNPEIGAQLFISPRTVEWHLGHVFAKLSITSRRDLPGALPPRPNHPPQKTPVERRLTPNPDRPGRLPTV
jgi:DNA-binding CsgD family transcriptional regulator